MIEHPKEKSLADQSRLRDIGEDAIIAALRRFGPLSRNELAERANLGRTTAFTIAKNLIGRGVLVEAQHNRQLRKRGRPQTIFALNPTIALFAGIEVARRRIRVLLINAAHEQVAYGEDELPSPGDPVALELVLALLERIARESGVSLQQIKHLGLGFSGLVDPVVPSQAIRKLVAGLEAKLGFAVRIANNSHLACLAESMWGTARNHNQVLYLHWSSGVGGGWVKDGALVTGAHGMAGEFGHFPIDPKNGQPCYCGARGCLETVAGLEALLLKVQKLGRNVATQHDLVEAVRRGDEIAARVFSEAAGQVGRAVASAAIILDPSAIVLGGEVSVLGELIVAPVRRSIETMLTPGFPRKIEVMAGQLGELGAVRGAVALVLPQIRFAREADKPLQAS